VIAELFMEGRSLFDLSQLLEYCSGDYSPDITLKRISDKHIRVCGVCGYSGVGSVLVDYGYSSPSPGVYVLIMRTEMENCNLVRCSPSGVVAHADRSAHD